MPAEELAARRVAGLFAAAASGDREALARIVLRFEPESRRCARTGPARGRPAGITASHRRWIEEGPAPALVGLSKLRQAEAATSVPAFGAVPQRHRPVSLDRASREAHNSAC